MKLSERLYLLLLVLLPTQLTLHFWPSFSFVNGIRVDYLSPVVYSTDLVFVLLLIVWFWEKRNKFKLRFNKILFAVILFAFVNIVISAVPQVTFFKWIKLLEIFLLYVYSRGVSKQVVKIIPYILMIDGVFILILSFAQIYLGRSIGGLMYFLGERTFNINTPRIALFNIGGREFLRPYATFPHPNSLAGFYLASIGFIAALRSKKIIKYLGYIIFGLIIILSLSQNAWIALILGLLFIFFERKKRLLKVFVILSILFSLTLPFISYKYKVFENSPREISQRVELSEIAIFASAAKPILGNGLGVFPVLVPKYSSLVNPAGSVIWWLQPVHNVPLLVLSETGLTGFVIALYLLFKFLNFLDTQDKNIKFIFLVIFLTSLFDHYWLTLEQNMLIMSIVFGVTIGKHGRHKNIL